MLPSNGFSMACFVSMVSPGEAAFAIRGLNNAQVPPGACRAKLKKNIHCSHKGEIWNFVSF